jgi:hypothetical protein
MQGSAKELAQWAQWALSSWSQPLPASYGQFSNVDRSSGREEELIVLVLYLELLATNAGGERKP